MRELYVYWKAPRSADVRAVIEAALADLMQQHPGLCARLLRRVDEGGDSLTWMETYASQRGITPAQQAAIEATLAPMLVRLGAGPRHTEAFEPAA
jgi:hypothetical protein